MHKKAQFTIFIILGIVILLSFSLVWTIGLSLRTITLRTSDNINTTKFIPEQQLVDAQIADIETPDQPATIEPDNLNIIPEESPTVIQIPIWISFSLSFIVVLGTLFGLLYFIFLNNEINILAEYISKNLILGFSAIAISNSLEQEGHKKERIEKAFDKLLKNWK